MNEQVQEIRYLVGEAWKGTYNGATTYGNANVVQDPTGLSVYRSLKPGNVGHALTDTAWWFCIIDLSSIKAESDRIAALNTAIAQDEQLRVAAEQQRVQAEQSRVDAEAGRVSAEAKRVQAESNRVSAENSRVLAEQGRVSAESARVQAESNRVSAEASRVLAEQGRVSAENQRAVNEENRQAVFAEDHRIAVADHQTAEADHTTAVADHETAVQDNAQMTVLVNRADADHVQAGQDHTRAESDHTTAAADHTQASTDHTTAASDHTQAETDHTRAENDHTRAESDHDAVELYVDSLGVFDLSKHNAVGGVLATYADLNAALTALNALESKYKYGGMSFKYVDSSDNKYVQYRLMTDEFTTDITQWQGVDTTPTPSSKNTVESGGVFSAIANKLKEIKANDDKDSFYIVDSSGNVIGKFDSEGLSTTDAKILVDGELVSIKELIQSKLKNIYDFLNGGLYVADSYGNVIMQVDANGIKGISPMNSLGGKKIVGVGDSLSTHGYGELCSLCGGTYIEGYSEGGTFTIPNALNSTQDRIKSLIESEVDVDVVILENVNDFWYGSTKQGNTWEKKGSLDDDSFMVSQYINHENSYTSAADAKAGFTTNFNSIVSGVTEKIKGTICRVKYTTQKILITVSGTATSTGTIVIELGEEIYTTQVESGMTSSAIAQLINVNNFVGYTHSVSGNTVTLVLQDGYTINTPSITNTVTGITVTNSSGTDDSYVNEYFIGYNNTEFQNIDYWTTDTPTLYSLYKGLYEYIQANNPNLRIVFFAPTVWSLNFDNPPSAMTNSDGSWNYKKIMDDDYFVRNKILREIQNDVATQYGCEFVDAMDGCGITPYNAEEYYYNRNVHPKAITYGVWANFLFRKLK